MRKDCFTDIDARPSVLVLLATQGLQISKGGIPPGGFRRMIIEEKSLFTGENLKQHSNVAMNAVILRNKIM